MHSDKRLGYPDHLETVDTLVEAKSGANPDGGHDDSSGTLWDRYMKETGYETLHFILKECAIAARPHSAATLIQHISAMGGTYLRENGDAGIDPSVGLGDAPASTGFYCWIAHPALARDPFADPKNPFPNRAHLLYAPRDRYLYLSQPFLQSTCDEVADGLLRFTRLLAPIAVPEFGCLDLSSHRSYLKDSAVGNASLSVLKWAVILGPKYIQQYGADGLLAAPCWHSERLHEEGILCVMTPTLSGWLRGRQNHLLRYFRQLDPTARWGKA